LQVHAAVLEEHLPLHLAQAARAERQRHVVVEVRPDLVAHAGTAWFSGDGFRARPPMPSSRGRCGAYHTRPATQASWMDERPRTATCAGLRKSTPSRQAR